MEDNEGITEYITNYIKITLRNVLFFEFLFLKNFFFLNVFFNHILITLFNILVIFDIKIQTDAHYLIDKEEKLIWILNVNIYTKKTSVRCYDLTIKTGMIL
jgi:hypothetical protein